MMTLLWIPGKIAQITLERMLGCPCQLADLRDFHGESVKINCHRHP